MRRSLSNFVALTFAAVLLLSTAALAGNIEVPIVTLTANADGSISGSLQTGISVSFTTAPLSVNGDDTLTVDPSGGPKLSIGAPDHSINNVTVTVPGGSFTDFSADLFGVYDQTAGGESCSLPDTSASAMCDPMSITINYSNGTSSSLSLTGLNTAPAGNNPFSITAPAGDYISSIFIGGLTLDTQAKFYALANVDLSGASVPEPGSIAMLGFGLLAFAGKLRRA